MQNTIYILLLLYVKTNAKTVVIGETVRNTQCENKAVPVRKLKMKQYAVRKGVVSPSYTFYT